MSQKQCAVCNSSLSKYKCSVCLIPYCSLPCYKTHKETPCEKAQLKTESLPQAPNREYEEDQLISEDRLKALALSPNIKKLLGDPQLRRILSEVNASTKVDPLLDHLLTESPLFREFAAEAVKCVGSSTPSKPQA
ncbi:uncharacterized protein BJ171DRAFT_494223 [Polychytrium aggregatum]|uniref:uncharacterized protein n=1 Tax=Polychytrium aggregatum TaxID=110093 RepID=UPI0022FEC64B|nr:uncharacterized protein BJ171DRAFT_494223 [Polychytrium aggregatum]KAI9207313.1 hypothetical protein BJ171DRAFT_494223 [Polychytrium aggregatum]